MAQPAHFSCNHCSRSFQTRRGLAGHITKCHSHPRPIAPRSTFRYHPHLTAQPCADNGDFINFGAPPPDEEDELSWAPFHDRPSFEFAELTYKKMQASSGDLDKLLELWAAYNVTNNNDSNPIFENAQELYDTIDEISHGDAPWQSFTLRHPGPVTDNSPSWQQNSYQVHCRDTHDVVRNILKNKAFDKKFDYVPYQEYTGPQRTRYSNLMSGQWAYTKAVGFLFSVVIKLT
jgi:hypothetical protein